METMTKSGLAPSKWRILRPRSGDTDRFLMVAEFASMAEFEEKAPNLKGGVFEALKKEMVTGGWLVGTDRAFSQILIED